MHTDIGGPVNTPTSDGEVYYQTIIDDFSHFTTVYLLKTKGQAKEKLMEYIRLLNAQGYKCAKIRSDHGGENNSRKLLDFCKTKGTSVEHK